MEWLEFQPWSPEVSQKVASVHAADPTRPAPAKKQDPKQTEGWQARLQGWPRHSPWGDTDA